MCLGLMHSHKVLEGLVLLRKASVSMCVCMHSFVVEVHSESTVMFGHMAVERFCQWCVC